MCITIFTVLCFSEIFRIREADRDKKKILSVLKKDERDKKKLHETILKQLRELPQTSQ